MSEGVKGAEASAEAQTISSQADLQFPVGRIHRLLRHGHYAQRVGSGAPVFMAAALECVTVKILEQAVNAARDDNEKRITTRHLQLAVRNDEELNKLMSGNIIEQDSDSDSDSNIDSELLPENTDEDSDSDSDIDSELLPEKTDEAQ
ncbi:histone H2A-beta, sperm-like [Branchiostoma floridae]|uniref:Histone H2A n=1 Tax=Branchiostoma floridae TaxID=7739 RepID=A0A9J7MGS0_BRAFL|nr:histone H2A-beta, sperm-like [Branchiostoma floridae]